MSVDFSFVFKVRWCLIAVWLSVGCGGGQGGKPVGKDGGSAAPAADTSSTDLAGALAGMAGSGGVAGSGGSVTGGQTGSGGSQSAADANADSTGTTRQCGSFDACGGSLLGVWAEPGALECGPSASTRLAAQCPGSFRNDQIDYSGTLTFSDGGVCNSAIVVTGTSMIKETASCLTGTAGCSSSYMNYSNDAGISQACIEDSSGDCTCTATYDHFHENQNCTYSIEGSVLTITWEGSSEAPQTGPYCVQGDRLRRSVFDQHTGESWVQAFARASP